MTLTYIRDPIFNDLEKRIAVMNVCKPSQPFEQRHPADCLSKLSIPTPYSNLIERIKYLLIKCLKSLREAWSCLYALCRTYDRIPQANPQLPFTSAVTRPPPLIPTKEKISTYPGDINNSLEAYHNIPMKQLTIHFPSNPQVDLHIYKRDLFASGAEVIVNAANTHLGGGGGIDGLIHRRGGPGYQREHQELQLQFQGRYTQGYAALIGSGDLSQRGIKKVIVVAAPDYRVEKDTHRIESQLYSCYYNSLCLAEEQGARSIALPSLGTGIFTFPKDRSAQISLRAVNDFLAYRQSSNLQIISIHFLPNEADINTLDYYKTACLGSLSFA